MPSTPINEQCMKYESHKTDRKYYKWELEGHNKLASISYTTALPYVGGYTAF